MNKIKPKSSEFEPPETNMGRELSERRKGKTRTGIVVDWEYTGGTIMDMKTNEQWPAFRFRIQGKRGGEWWTSSYADKTKPVPKTLHDLKEALVAINKSKAHAASWAGMLGPYIAKVDRLIALGTP